MKKKIIETGFCPKCKNPLCHGGVSRFNNDFKELNDTISQIVFCDNCKKYFEIIFAPIEIVSSNKKEFDGSS